MKSKHTLNREILCTVGALILLLSGLKSERSLTTIQGTVLSAQTGKPIKGALVYVVAGEEEALTKDNGVFKITTSQKTPVTVTAEHQQYHTGRISITDTRQQIIVRLKAK